MHAKELDRAFDERQQELRRGYAVDMALQPGVEIESVLHDRRGIVLFSRSELRVLHKTLMMKDLRGTRHDSRRGKRS